MSPRASKPAPDLFSSLPPSTPSRIRVGIGGWTYVPWRGGMFYPVGLVQRRELEFASRQLTSIEVNGTYYGVHKPATYAKWRDETPDGFVFSAKAPQRIMESKSLAKTGPQIEDFIGGIVELGDKLGPLVWQFDKGKRIDAEAFEAFVGLVGRRLRGITSARRTSSARRSSASSRFRLWLRMSLATTRMLTSVVSLERSLSMRRARSPSEIAFELWMFQKISTRDDVLFTCCPPAPDERDTRTSSSLRGIATDSFTNSELAVGGEVILSAPAKQFERREEAHHTPDEDNEKLWRYRRQRRPLEHVGAQRVIDRRERQETNERLHGLREI